eukprot:811884_1
MSNKKKLLGSGAALAGIAGIGLFVKQFIDRKKNANNTEDTDTKEQSPKQLNRLSLPLPTNYIGVKIELPDYYEKLLNDLPEPKLLYKHFMICLSTPRPSHKLDKMRATLKNTADLLGIEYTQDKTGMYV